MAEYFRLVDSGDYVTAIKTYMLLPPNVSADQFLAFLQQNQNFKLLEQKAHDVFQAAQGVTPTYNDTGDLATYNFTATADGETSVKMRKIGDYWYFDPSRN